MLKQIEADVVIAIQHPIGIGSVHPYWECERSFPELRAIAEQHALELVENIGHGAVTYKIYDFRKPRKN